MEITRWLMLHGDSLLESAGIIGGLIFTGVGLHRDSKARRIDNMISLMQQHRDIWLHASETSGLARVLESERDVLREPPSFEENIFVRSLILYLSTVFKAIHFDEMLRPQGMERDIQFFFSKPVPRIVWNDVKRFHDDDFVMFVEKEIKFPFN